MIEKRILLVTFKVSNLTYKKIRIITPNFIKDIIIVE